MPRIRDHIGINFVLNLSLSVQDSLLPSLPRTNTLAYGAVIKKMKCCEYGFSTSKFVRTVSGKVKVLRIGS
jgi:hypothetical protein